jgi:hypothetical protein
MKTSKSNISNTRRKHKKTKELLGRILLSEEFKKMLAVNERESIWDEAWATVLKCGREIRYVSPSKDADLKKEIRAMDRCFNRLLDIEAGIEALVALPVNGRGMKKCLAKFRKEITNPICALT